MHPERGLRCAIYARRSSEEGLQREFNSLQAQREACEAYVRSQAHSGWTYLPDGFDDAGYSGGNMDRPALKSLLAMVEREAVDVVVVYKVDRLSRSLVDFAKIAEILGRHQVSLVAVTQQFDTTSSIGQLTLNVLLSFAQFERELTGERIREKIEASKNRGMWMGGPPPIGYDAVGGELFVNRDEAEVVRRIFKLYLEEETVPRLARRLRREGVLTARRSSARGDIHGGRPFSRGHLPALLSSPIYVGRVPHKKRSHPGRHEPLVDSRTWDAVQAQLEAEEIAKGLKAAKGPVLGSLLVSERGRPFHHVHARKGTRRYRYYVEHVSTAEAPTRLSAPEIEMAVAAGVRGLLVAEHSIVTQLGPLAPAQVTLATAALRLMRHKLRSPSALRAMRPALAGAVCSRDRLVLTVSVGAARRLMGLPPGEEDRFLDYEILIPRPVARPGRPRMKLIVTECGSPPPDPVLIQSVARARAWADQLISGEVASIAEISRTGRFGEAYIRKVLPLAFLPPRTLEAILNGQVAPGLGPGTRRGHE